MKCRFLMMVSMLCYALTAQATMQFPELITIDNIRYHMYTYPLDGIIDANEKTIAPYLDIGNCSALWRGYRRQWKILNSCLYLVHVDKQVCRKAPYEPVPLSILFPDHKERPIWANWFSGVLQIPLGKALFNYPHPIPQRYLQFFIRNGIVVSQHEIDNPQYQAIEKILNERKKTEHQ